MIPAGIVSGVAPAGILIYFYHIPAYMIYGALVCLFTGGAWLLKNRICKNNKYIFL